MAKETKKYIKIINYMSGPSLKEQIGKIEDKGLMDRGTRLFFANNNTMSMRVVAELLHRFDAEVDDDLNDNNVVFKPQEWYIQSLEK